MSSIGFNHQPVQPSPFNSEMMMTFMTMVTALRPPPPATPGLTFKLDDILKLVDAGKSTLPPQPPTGLNLQLADILTMIKK